MLYFEEYLNKSFMEYIKAHQEKIVKFFFWGGSSTITYILYNNTDSKYLLGNYLPSLFDKLKGLIKSHGMMFHEIIDT